MPLYETREQIIAHLDDSAFIYGEVVLDVDDIVNADPDDFLDLLSEELVGSDALLEIEYRPLSVDTEGRIVMGVYGNPRIVLQDLEAEERAASLAGGGDESDYRPEG